MVCGALLVQHTTRRVKAFSVLMSRGDQGIVNRGHKNCGRYLSIPGLESFRVSFECLHDYSAALHQVYTASVTSE